MLDKLTAFGAWLKRASTATKVGLLAAGLVLYAAIHGVLVNLGLAEKPAKPVAETVATAAPVEPKAPSPPVVVRPYLRQTLHDWDSYESVGYSSPVLVNHAGQTVYRVAHQYRAKNGFGAMRLTTQVFYYTTEGKIVDVQ